MQALEMKIEQKEGECHASQDKIKKLRLNIQNLTLNSAKDKL